MNAAPFIIWKQAPFIRITCPFITGIIIQFYTASSIQFIIIAAAAAVSTILALARAPVATAFKYKNFPGYALLFLLLCSGAWRMNIKTEWLKPTPIIQPADSIPSYLAILQEPVTEKNNSFKSVALITHQLISDSLIPFKARIILYLQKNDISEKLYAGDQIVFNQQPQPIKPPANPGSFDFKSYCQKQGIFYQVFLRTQEFKLVKKQTEFTFEKSIYILRDFIVDLLRRHIPGTKESGFAEALLIGYKDDLDKSLIQTYSNTGVIHVIAISGLHLGLIYMLLSLVCKPMGNKKWSRIFRPIFIITGLWTFGFLAGGSPSILRSAMMFTCIAIGNSISKQSSIFNSLAASAFLLLWYNPYWLWDAGFQLSYTAVASLVIFQQKVLKTLEITIKWINAVWQLTATTIAAQILTLPVILYLFHQFPVFFLITNLVAIPLSSIILLGEIALCALSFMPVLAIPLGNLLSWLIQIMNKFVECMEKLPFASITQINISQPQVLLLYIAIAFASIWIFSQQTRMLLPALTTLLIYFIFGAIDNVQIRQQRKLVIYHIPRTTAVDCIVGNQFVPAGDNSAQHDFQAELFCFGPARNLFEVKHRGNIDGVYINKNLVSVGDKTMIIIDSSLGLPPPAETPVPAADILLVSHNPPQDPSIILARLPTRKLVIDGSNSDRITRKWSEIGRKSGIPVHSTACNGAFVLNAY